MQTKNALANLKNRYKAVLEKCQLLNKFGSLALVSLITVSGSIALHLAQPNIALGDVIIGKEIISTTDADVDASGYNGTPPLSPTPSNNDDVVGGNAFTRNDNTSGNVDGGDATANYNRLSISNLTLSIVQGGSAFSSGGADRTNMRIGKGGVATANYNEVFLDNVEAQFLYGGNASSQGGYISSFGEPGETNANNNSVILKNTSLASTIDGGYANSLLDSSVNAKATANFNSILIENSTVTSVIYVGNARGNDESRAENNSITLKGNSTLTNASIYGGNFDNGAGTSGTAHANAFNGNKLILDNYTGTVDTIKNIEEYSFILSSSIAKDATILTVTNLFLDNSESDAATKSASISSITAPQASPLEIGDSITLIDYNTVDGTLANDGGTVTSDATTFTQQEWEVNQDDTDTKITATFLSETAKKAETESLMLSQTRASSAVLKASSLLIADEAMSSAKSASSDKILTTDDNNAIGQLSAENGLNAGSIEAKTSTWSPFALLQGGYNSFDSGSETDVTSISFMGGLARTSYFDKGELMLGAFFETGTGSYDTKSNIGGTRIDSDGNLNYYGAGILSRYDFYTENGTPYLEASARLGSINSDYDTNDIIDVTTGAGVNYETNAMYYGLHLGAGHIFQIAEQWKLDVSAKYFWTHNESVEEEIGGNRFDFDSINSHVARLGAKVTYDAINNGTYSFSPYAGLAYEYEFDSNASARVDNIAIPADSDLQGSTAVLELGAQYKHINGLTLSAGIEGSLGKREGVNGKLEFIYEF